MQHTHNESISELRKAHESQIEELESVHEKKRKYPKVPTYLLVQ